MLDIYIPSYGRSDAYAIRRLSEAKIPFTIVLDHEEDLMGYSCLRSETTNLLLIKKGGGIGYVRQFIKSRYRGVPLIMIDDDTTFAYRRTDWPSKHRSCNDKNKLLYWFKTVDQFCADNVFDIGGVADTLWSRENTAPILEKGPLCSVTIFNSPRCEEVDYDPNLYSRMEDWDLICQAITKRFKFFVCNTVLRHCPMNKAAKDEGGCSYVYKDKTEMWRTTNYLRNKWGADIVKINTRRKIGDCFDFSVDLKKLRSRYGYNY